jgi:hypothetical protein
VRFPGNCHQAAATVVSGDLRRIDVDPSGVARSTAPDADTED